MNRARSVFIRHEPFAKPYRGRRPQAPLAYEQAVVRATQVWPMVKCPCLLRVTFMLGPEKFADGRGPELGTLLKRLLDALKQTVFRRPGSEDSYVVALEAAKTRVAHAADAGVQLEIAPLQTLNRAA